MVADGGDLFKKSLKNLINYGPDGSKVMDEGSTTKLWSGSDEKGKDAPDNCNDWQSGSGDDKGAIGLADQKDKWLSENVHACSDAAYMICISQ